MRTNVLVASLLLFVLPLLAQDPKPGSQVTIPLERYETLRRTSDSPSATVVDTILLGGGFREKNLSITFTGRATGARPLVQVMNQTNDVTISGCKGDAMLSRSGKGTFDLVPLADAFEVRCDLSISGSDRLRMHVAQSVLAVRSSVADAELLAGDEDETGARDYTLVRHVAGPGEILAATATGRYLITLLPDATRFRYAIDVHNPNRTTSSLELALQSNEHLQQIDSAAPYEVAEGRYVFSIPPGDSTITLTGELRGTAFTAPVRASLQYLVIESHPLLRPTVQTPAKRISISETGVTPQYRGALAFETGTERIAWQVTRLQALHSTGYAVNDASHRLFVPVDGPVLGETTFALRNEGAPELVLPQKPEPTYVSLGGDAVLMTKNAAGQLTVPLSQGEQQVLVQHRQPLRRGLGFALGSVAVPQLSEAATQTTVVLSYPEQWVPLLEKFGSRARVWTPDAGDVLLFLLIVVWLERLLAWLAVPAPHRFVISLLAALAASLVSAFLVLVIVACSALTIAWIIGLPIRTRVVVGVLFIGAVLLGMLFLSVNNRSGRYGYGAPSESVTSVGTDTAIDKVQRANAPEPVPAYQGLPAKFTLPPGERSSMFSQELLRADRPQAAFVFAVSFALTNWIGVLLALIVIVMLWRDRYALAQAIRERIARPNKEVVET